MTENELERLFDFGTARREKIPLKSGRPIAPSTLWRWIRKGVNGAKLNVTYVGGTPYLSQRLLDEFFAAVTQAKLKPQETTDAELQAELQAAGLV